MPGFGFAVSARNAAVCSNACFASAADASTKTMNSTVVGCSLENGGAGENLQVAPPGSVIGGRHFAFQGLVIKFFSECSLKQ